MGWYDNHSGTNRRQGFEYEYRGSQLIDYAENQLKVFTEREAGVRSQIAKLLSSGEPFSRHEIDGLTEEAEGISKDREMLAVMAHEFRRTPEQNFKLYIGDVVFLGIVR